MRISERAKKVNADKANLEYFISEYQSQHSLTDIEVMQALNSYQQTLLKYMLRYERHGDMAKPADED
jgi:hypothetical protein